MAGSDNYVAALPSSSAYDAAPHSGHSWDEECELAARIATGDREARDHLVQANLRLLMKIARALLGRGLDFDDLVGEGNLGLIRAAKEFDPRFGDAVQHLCRRLDQGGHPPRPDQHVLDDPHTNAPGGRQDLWRSCGARRRSLRSQDATP
jgi:hypothetical protein